MGGAGGDGRVVGRLHGPAQGWVAAADVGQRFRGQFGLDARFAEDEGLVFRGVWAQDA